MVHRILTRAPVRAAGRALEALGRGLLDLALPPFCLGCGERVRTARTILCFACLRAADRADADDIYERLERLSGARQAVDGAFALWIFDKGGLLQHVHRDLKYGNRPHYGVLLGRMLGCAYEQTFERRPPPDVIVPIPLHRSRLYERGYNQSVYLARGLSEAIDVPVEEDALARRRSTVSQTRLSRQDRQRNLDQAFVPRDGPHLRGRRVLLVDDILTTGATLVAAGAALREHGVEAVDLAVLAVART